MLQKHQPQHVQLIISYMLIIAVAKFITVSSVAAYVTGCTLAYAGNITWKWHKSQNLLAF